MPWKNVFDAIIDARAEYQIERIRKEAELAKYRERAKRSAVSGCHYVYLYRDPISQEIAYIGKGCRDRAFSHLVHALAGDPDSKAGHWLAGLIGKHEITALYPEIVACFDTNDAALLEERRLIDEYRPLLNTQMGKLTKGGHHPYPRVPGSELAEKRACTGRCLASKMPEPPHAASGHSERK